MAAPALKLSEAFGVAVPPDELWPLLKDPSTVVSCMPGARITAVNEDGSLDGSMVVKLGPTAVEFRGTVVPVFDDETHSGRLDARGADVRGRTKAKAETSFSVTRADDHGHSAVHVEAVIEVVGALATFVRSGGQHLARRLMKDFAENLAVLAQSQNGATPDERPSGPTDGPDADGAAAPPGAPVGGFQLLWRTLLDIIRGLWRGRTRRNDEISTEQGDGDEGR